jgi:hypothetical protein
MHTKYIVDWEIWEISSASKQRHEDRLWVNCPLGKPCPTLLQSGQGRSSLPGVVAWRMLTPSYMKRSGVAFSRCQSLTYVIHGGPLLTASAAKSFIQSFLYKPCATTVLTLLVLSWCWWPILANPSWPEVGGQTVRGTHAVWPHGFGNVRIKSDFVF